MSELAEYVNGRATKPTERVSDGVPVIKIAELSRGISDRTDRVPARRVQDRHWVRDGDLLFAWSGSVGVHVYQGDPAALNQHIFRVVARPGIDQRFLRYLLEGQMVTFEGFVADKRTTMGHVTIADLKRTEVPVPPITQQRRIALVLGSLDDRIENNRRIAKTLEEIAATLFKARFVDFVDQGDLVESEIGPIPRGWRVVLMSDAVAINPRVNAIKKGSRIPHVGMSDVPSWGARPDGGVESREYTGGARFEPGDTLMARITGCIEHGKGAFVDFLDGPGSGSTEFLVLRAKSPLTPEMVFLLSRTPPVREHAIANMGGSSGRQRVQTSAFDHLPIAVPPDAETLAEEADLFRVIFQRTRALWQENHTLAALRDALLPRLISGQIRVPASGLEKPPA